MKVFEIQKLKRVEAYEQFKTEGIVAFQLVNITVDFFGRKMTNRYDTKIMADGRQIVIDGDGWIKDGTLINELVA